MPQLTVDDADYLELIANTGAADGGERAWVVLLLARDLSEFRRPGAIGIAQRMPQLTVDDADRLELIADAGTANVGEPTWIVLFLDASNGRRPGPVGLAYRMPRLS